MLSRRRFEWLGLLAVVCCHAQAGPVTQIQSWGAVTAPATFIYGDSFNDLDPSAAGVQISPAGTSITLQTRDEFHDHYLFSVGPVVASFVTLTIDLGNVFNIDGLTVDLYDASGLGVSVLGSPSLLSPPARLVSSVAVARPGPGEQQAINAAQLAAGSYLLDVRGFVTGAAGGSYSGVVNLASVSEPGSAALVLPALGLAVWVARRRRIQTDHDVEQHA